MAWLLSVLGIMVGLAGTFLYMWVALIPRIGLRPLQGGWRWKGALALLSMTLAGVGYRLRPARGSLIAWILTGVLGIMTNLIYPPHIFKTLRFPKHVNADAADLGDNAPVLGFETGGVACAWPMEVVVPRHLIQDQVGDTPVLVAY